MSRSKVSIVRCKSYETAAVESAVKMAVDLLGGIEKIIKPGSRVLLKPNLLSARLPEEGVDTHPEVVRAVARLIKPVASKILVGDSPGGWHLKGVDGVYERSGMKRMCEEEGLTMVKFDKAVEIDGFPIASVIKEVDSIISIPKLKTHSTNIITGAVKNMFGAVIGLSKAQCHLDAPSPHDFAARLIRVFDIAKPALSIMDGIVGMEGDGPAGGTLRDIGLVMASTDAVSLDAVFSDVIGMDPFKVPTNLAASRKNMGIADLDKIDVFGEKPEQVRIMGFKLPKMFFVHNLPVELVKFGTKHIKFHPYILKNKCRKCGLCVSICPKKTIKTVKGGALEVDLKGCIHCFCCHEVCPHNAIMFKKSLLAKIIMR